MRTLGYATNNGRLATGLRLRVEALGFDTGHFTYGRGGRTWPAAELEASIKESVTWSEAVGRLGASTLNGDTIAKVRGLAAKYGIDSRHFVDQRGSAVQVPFTAPLDARHLRTAAASMAMAWFALRGYIASLPAEPRPYDLIVEAEKVLYKVQIKTATKHDPKSGAVVCNISHVPCRDGRQIAYDPADVDFFFIIDDQDRYFIVPISEVVGITQISLNTLLHRQVGH